MAGLGIDDEVRDDKKIRQAPAIKLKSGWKFAGAVNYSKQPLVTDLPP